MAIVKSKGRRKGSKKLITAAQKSARRKNIAVARKARKISKSDRKRLDKLNKKLDAWKSSVKKSKAAKGSPYGKRKKGRKGDPWRDFYTK